MIKLEVGKTYELNNGEIHKCTKVLGDDQLSLYDYNYGPFVIDGCAYHQDGRFGDCNQFFPLSVKRCVEEDFGGVTLSSITVDSIAQDSLKWHYENGGSMEPIEKEAFRIVMRYYGMSF